MVLENEVSVQNEKRSKEKEPTEGDLEEFMSDSESEASCDQVPDSMMNFYKGEFY